MESTTADELFDAIGRDVDKSLQPVGKDIVQQVQQRLSVPVERVPITEIERRKRRARGAEATRLNDALTKTFREDPIFGEGYKLLRSIKGEPARLETGRLRESIEYLSADFGGDSELIVFSDLDYAAFLEQPPFDRLVLTDEAEPLLDSVLDAHVRGIEGA